MPLNANNQQQPATFDFRIYLGMLFFRWQTIVVCFLYCLLGGVLYLNFTPKRYRAACKVMVYRNSYLLTQGHRPWGLGQHMSLIRSRRLHERVVTRLRGRWAPVMGNALYPRVNAVKAGGSGGMNIFCTVDCKNPAYAKDFLTLLMEEYKDEWRSVQRESTVSVTDMLEESLTGLDDRIRQSEDDVLEYKRLHDVVRQDAKARMDDSYLQQLVRRENQLTTELILLENHYPFLKESNVGVLTDLAELTQTTAIGSRKPDEDDDERAAGDDMLPVGLKNADLADFPEHMQSWTSLRVSLARLKQEDRELSENLDEDHPVRRGVHKRIAKIESDLEVAAQVIRQGLKDRHTALRFQLNAIEQALYRWHQKDLLAGRRRGELSRLQNIARRYTTNYNLLFGRLHETRISRELEAENVRLVEAVRSSGVPFWPDGQKILLVSVVMGLGSGFGLALLAQTVDNKVQSIKDVETILGIPFLGGIPYWARSGLEKSIRPIVTEEHSAGAIEAYRALRTNIISALNKMNEKIVLVTSADSREGKTLTALNLAIMIAQMGKRVLLVDMDLRRGRLHRSLGIEREPGVTDVLRGKNSLRDIIRATSIPQLDLAPTGGSSESAAELLQSTDLVSFFVNVQDDYDYIIVDTSPVLRVTDTVILATEGIGVVLYVARVNRTPKPLIRYSLDMLKDARVLGLIMNSIEMHKVSSLYYAYQYPNYAYYSNAYSYGYSYYDYGDDRSKRKRRHRRGSGGNRWQSRFKRIKQSLLPME